MTAETRTPTDELDRLRAALDTALGTLDVEEDVIYDLPIAMSGEPMDPVPFVNYKRLREALVAAAPDLLSRQRQLERIAEAARRVIETEDEFTQTYAAADGRAADAAISALRAALEGVRSEAAGIDDMPRGWSGDPGRAGGTLCGECGELDRHAPGCLSEEPDRE